MTTVKNKAARPGRVKAAQQTTCDGNHNSFSERLRQAFALRGINTTMARVDKLILATGCSRRTALRWLSGGAMPGRGNHIVQIATALDVDPAWLAGAANKNPMLAAFTRKFLQISPELQLEAVRLLDRLGVGMKHS